jgi:putative membrane protein
MVRSAALTDADKGRIEAAIADLETRTSAELAVVIARRSHDYAAYPFLWAAALALLAGGALALLFPRALPIEVVLLEGCVFAAIYLVLHFTPLGIALTPARMKETNARQLAAAQFASVVAQRTQNRAGLLLFVSLAERHIEILVDRGVDERIGRERWPTIVTRFRSTGGPLAERLAAAIEECASTLEECFPPSPGEPNEMPDQVKEM